MADDPCIEQQLGRRRMFWSTQPQGCGEYTLCGFQCVIPGLQYVDDESGPSVGRSISTEQWIRGLILNILNTRARSDLNCPAPAAVYGHWSESYRKDNLYIGSQLWNAAQKTYTRTADTVRAVTAAIQADMAKLTALKLADDVKVEAAYAGRSTVAVNIVVTKNQYRSVLSLSGRTDVSGTWMWQ